MAKIDLEELLADREAGTDGPWHVRTLENFGFNVVHYVHGDKHSIARIAKIPLEQDARRIARLPTLEAAYIEAVETLRKIASCDSHADGDVVDLARKFLESHK